MARAPSPWMTEKYQAPNGNWYQRYVFDSQGNRIPRDSSLSQEEIQKLLAKGKQPKVAKTKEGSAEHKQKKAVAYINKMVRQNRKQAKLPSSSVARLCANWNNHKAKQGTVLGADYGEGSDSYHVVLFDIEKDWLLIHANLRKGTGWVDDWFFFNPYNKDFVPFDVKSHIRNTPVQFPEKSQK